VNHFSKTIIALIASSIWFGASTAANAATMYFAPDSPTSVSGSIDVVLPVDKMGTLPVPRGRIQINGNSADLTMIPEWMFDRQHVLQGTVLDTRIDNTGKQPIMRGVIIWTEGPWIEYFDDRKPDEEVVANGITTVGRVSEITPTDIAVESGGTVKRTPLAAVTEIRSSRVYNFAIPTTSLQQPSGTQQFYTDARSIAMVASAKPFRLPVLKSSIQRQMDTGEWSTKKCIAVGSLLSLVELSQLVPVMVVPIAAGGPYQHQLVRREMQVAAQGH
jgi:hypothetical protein